MASKESKLNKLEEELSSGKDKIQLQNGNYIYVDNQQLLTVYAEAIEYTAKGEDADWSELSEITQKIGEEAVDGQEPVQRARIMLGKESQPDEND